MLRALPLAVALLFAPGCLVLSLHPAYDDETIAWEPALVGSWFAPDDKVTMDIERAEWKSYKIKYVHTIETATITGYLTMIGDDRYLDVMPVRGQDPGSFAVPAHAIVRVSLQGDRLELTPLSYDWFHDRLRSATVVAGLAAVKDQKENAIIVSPTSRLRTWLRGLPSGAPMFGAAAVFVRQPGTAGAVEATMRQGT